MSWRTDMLRESRLTRLIEDVENGRPVDFDRLAALQTLDVAQIGRLFLAEAIDFQESEDLRYEQIMKAL